MTFEAICCAKNVVNVIKNVVNVVNNVTRRKSVTLEVFVIAKFCKDFVINAIENVNKLYRNGLY